MKRCSKCRQEKPLTGFHRNRRTADGLHLQCKDCRSTLDTLQRSRVEGSRNENRRLLAEGLRRCRTCKIVKPADDFYKAPSNADGLNSKCAPCYNEAVAEYASLPRTKALRGAQYRRMREQDEGAWRVRQRAYSFRYKYGIELEHYEAMLEAQHGRCWICETMAAPDLTLFVDHDHDTGQVRGLLCRRCNSGLGMFGDDPELMARALSYLTERAPAASQIEAS